MGTLFRGFDTFVKKLLSSVSSSNKDIELMTEEEKSELILYFAIMFGLIVLATVGIFQFFN